MREGVTATSGIERELDHARSRLDITIGALREKLAPGNMVDQAVGYFKEGGGVEFGRNLCRSMRDNPIPVALIGVGIGWLAWSNAQGPASHTSPVDSANDSWRDRSWRRDDRRGGGMERDRYEHYRSGSLRTNLDSDTAVHEPMPYEAAAQSDLAMKAQRAGDELQREADEADDAFQDRIDAARGTVLGLTRETSEAADGFRTRITDAMAAAAQRVRSAAGDMSEAAGDFAARGQTAARDLYRYGSSAAAGARDRTGDAMGQMHGMGSRTVDYMQDRPLLLGALGLTVGAVIGLLVPATRYERRLAGSLRDSLGETARQMAGDAGARVARVADSVLGTAQDAAKREGFVSSADEGVVTAARERVADVAGRARQVVEETAAAGREAIKRELPARADIKGDHALKDTREPAE